MILTLITLIIGFLFLVKGSDFLVDSSSEIARKLGISEFIIGVTIVAIGTSLPELASSMYAAFLGDTDIAVGNVVGSNIANIALVLGASALIMKIRTKEKILTDDLVLLLGSAIIFTIILMHGTVKNYFGVLLLIIYVAYTIKLIIDYRRNHRLVRPKKDKIKIKDIILVIIGSLGVVIGARLAIDSAINIATIFNITNRIIGLTLVALGTSLPELAISLNATLKKKAAIAIGNIAGSNAFNILGVIGLTSIIKDLPVNPLILHFDVPIMLLLSFLLVFIWEKDITRFEGLVLVSIYIAYLIMLFI